MNNRIDKLSTLLKLSHDLANPLKPLSILGEGNTSARLSDKTFLVKASGSCLGSLRKEDVVECRADLLLQMLDETGLSDAEVDGPLDGIAGGCQGQRSRRWKPYSMPGC